MADASPRPAPPEAGAGTAPDNRLRVIFLGPPGAGKGTQAARLSGHCGVPRISTGDILRDAIARGTPLGQKAAPIMERGALVPDNLLIGIIQERLFQDDCRDGYILDGFPRTLRQAEGFEHMAGGDATATVFVLNVEVPREELLRRLSGRRMCPLCQTTFHVDGNRPRVDLTCDNDGTMLTQREDDREAAVMRRLVEYDARTAPLIDYYRPRSRFHTVNGDRAVDDVFEDLRRIVEGLARPEGPA